MNSLNILNEKDDEDNLINQFLKLSAFSQKNIINNMDTNDDNNDYNNNDYNNNNDNNDSFKNKSQHNSPKKAIQNSIQSQNNNQITPTSSMSKKEYKDQIIQTQTQSPNEESKNNINNNTEITNTTYNNLINLNNITNIKPATPIYLIQDKDSIDSIFEKVHKISQLPKSIINKVKTAFKKKGFLNAHTLRLSKNLKKDWRFLNEDFKFTCSQMLGISIVLENLLEQVV